MSLTVFGNLPKNKSIKKVGGPGGIAPFKLVYVSGDNTVLTGNNDALASSKILGMTENAIADGATGDITYSGEIVNAAWSFTPDADLFLDGSGDLTEDVPAAGKVSILCAIATGTDRAMINPQIASMFLIPA